MVSSALKIELQELLDILEESRRDYATDPEYQELRGELPTDWPL
jgi:hypothetical protein